MWQEDDIPLQTSEVLLTNYKVFILTKYTRMFCISE
jgi:hypothetical protein